MKNVYFFYITVFLSLLICSNSVAQQINLNSATNGSTISSCAVRILDSGGLTNDYGFNQD